jgi:hypothetical protein
MPQVWIHQNKVNGLGDFIRICPTIQTLAIKHRQPIPVLFDHQGLREVFCESSYIEVLKKKPENPPLFDTNISWNKNIKYGATRNKYNGIHNTIHGHENYPPPQIGITIPYRLPKENCVAVINGLGAHIGFYKKFNKDVGKENRQYIVDSLVKNGYNPVILGTNRDKELFWRENNLEGCVNLLGKTTLAQAASIINQCEFFVSNDTCLYHFASALNKRGIVFWLDTTYENEGNAHDKSFIRHYKSKDRLDIPSAMDSYLQSSLPESNRLFPRYELGASPAMLREQ